MLAAAARTKRGKGTEEGHERTGHERRAEAGGGWVPDKGRDCAERGRRMPAMASECVTLAAAGFETLVCSEMFSLTALNIRLTTWENKDVLIFAAPLCLQISCALLFR